MAYTLLIIPVTMLLAGIMLYKYPLKKINFFIGYRTCKSMKDKKSWDIANRYCGEICIKLGVVLLVIFGILTAILCFNVLFLTETAMAIIVLCQCLAFVIPMYLVEKKINEQEK